MRLLRGGTILVLAACGCGEEEPPTTTSVCEPPARVVSDRCVEPGVQDDGCAAGTWAAADGTCQPAGVPLEGCREGFEQLGDGPCEPILPVETCPYGLMAIPGDRACRPVMDCGTGRWGNLPVDTATVYVDGAYTGGASDGSEAHPWTTISQAVEVAPAGALIAVAAGSYAEDVRIVDVPLRLWGVCPERVSLVGIGAQDSALMIGYPTANGTEVGGMAIQGLRGSAFVSGAVVTFDRVWVRESSIYAGMEIHNVVGATAVTLRDSLIENNHYVGIYAGGVELTIERSVVRGTLPNPSDSTWGRGVQIQPQCDEGACNLDVPSNAVIRSSVIEQNHQIGVAVASSHALIEATVIRRTLPTLASGSQGYGVGVNDCDLDEGCVRPLRGSVIVRDCHVSEVVDTGIYVTRADLTLEGSVIRGVAPTPAEMDRGRGIALEGCGPGHGCDPPRRATGSIRGTLVEHVHDLGIFVMASDATIEGSSVRDVQPRAFDGLFGRGIVAQIACADNVCDGAAPAKLVVRGARLDDSDEFGISAIGSEVTIEASRVQATAPQLAGGVFGDGTLVTTHDGSSAFMAVSSSWIEDSARSGIAVFGASGTFSHNAIVCALIPLVTQPIRSTPAVLEDDGDNRCGCPAPDGPCQAISAGVEPPPPLEP